jgi:RNA polymerase sigma-70 factor, ECF subfamily
VPPEQEIRTVKKVPAKHLGLVLEEFMQRRHDALDDTLDRVYERHVSDVSRWMRRLIGPRQDVEDLIHEVFLVALRRRGSFRGDASVKTWLFRITHQVARSRRGRERWRRWLFLRHASGLADARPAPVTPLEEIEQREQIARLYQALDRLPDDQRTALILFEIEGLPGDEVAELLGLTIGAVWVRLHRGRARLLKELSKEDNR